MTARSLSANGNWSSAATWSPAGVPTAADTLSINTSYTLTVDGTSASPNLCRSFSGTPSSFITTSTSYIKVGDGTAGATTFPNKAITSGTTVEFVSTVTGNTIGQGPSTGSINIIINGVGGGWTLSSALVPGGAAIPTLTLINGTFDLNGHNVANYNFSSNNSNTRNLIIGAQTWYLGSSTTNDLWDITNSTGMTLSMSGGAIQISSTSGNTVFHGGGLTYDTVLQTSQNSTGTTLIDGANTFGTLTLSGNGGGYAFGDNQTVTGTWTGHGSNVASRLYYRSTVRGTPRTISAGTFDFTNIDLEDMVHGGAGSGNISAITGGSGDCTGNSGWTFTTPANQYWVPSGGTSTGSESSVANWASSSGGTAGTGRSPLPQDTAIFDANSIDAGSRTITQDKPRIGAHVWTGVTNTPTWAKTTVSSFYSDIIMPSSGVTNTGTVVYTYAGEKSSNLDIPGNTFTNPITIDCSSAGTLVVPTGNTETLSGTLNTKTGTLSILGTLVLTGGVTFTGGNIKLGFAGKFEPNNTTGTIIEATDDAPSSYTFGS